MRPRARRQFPGCFKAIYRKLMWNPRRLVLWIRLCKQILNECFEIVQRWGAEWHGDKRVGSVAVTIILVFLPHAPCRALAATVPA